MDYRYLKVTGALNETGRPTAPARRAAAATWRGRTVPPSIIELLPESLARENTVFPVAVDGETVTVVSADPDNIALADKISFVLAKKVKLVPARHDEIEALILRHYGAEDTTTVNSMLQELPDEIAAGRALWSAGPLPAATMIGTMTPRAHLAQAPIARGRSGDREPGRASADFGLDTTASIGDSGVFTYVVEEGQRVLMRRPDGTMDVIVGPKRIMRWWNVFRPMLHFVAHPGDYLIVRYRDGRQEHLAGPSEVWFDPRVHQEVTREEALQVAAKEAVVVYSQKDGTTTVQRRVEFGPTVFIPRPGEWLHTFSWHSSEGGSKGIRKVPNGLVFQKLWLMPDQMYHDVPDVRTADDAVLTIRLMIFFELLDITTMLETTHDPIGDFVNATTSDVVDFTVRHDFESFKRNTDKLNELSTYRQLTGRAAQCGYRINKVVYRGYGAPDRLQQMHDQAIEARTRLQLERATEQQAQDLENFKLDAQMQRAGKRRQEQSSEVKHDLELASQKQSAALRDREAQLVFQREQTSLAAELKHRLRAARDSQRRDHLDALRSLGVDLTAYLTQARADRVIELRGPGGATHVHIDPAREADGKAL